MCLLTVTQVHFRSGSLFGGRSSVPFSLATAVQPQRLPPGVALPAVLGPALPLCCPTQVGNREVREPTDLTVCHSVSGVTGVTVPCGVTLTLILCGLGCVIELVSLGFLL